jgi:3-hydroxyacyl-CoA dehydrogenase/enoyl-CoA hydratase/3-hydroxybutyryl-CoA epimerase
MSGQERTDVSEQDVIRRVDEDGIVTLVLDDPARSANTLSPAFRAALAAAVERLEADRESIRGVVLTSAKKTFFAGGDLEELVTVTPADTDRFRAEADGTKAVLRRLETLGVPVVAALNGAALGGGLEIALATHHRIAARTAIVGLPEVTLGLLPGGGGVVRTVRLLGLETALGKVLLPGTPFGADAARDLRLVDEVVDTPEELAAAAKAWIDSAPDPTQPWDRKGYRIPGKGPEELGGVLTAALHKRVKGAPLPAPRAILAAAVEGTRVGFDAASAIETRYFLGLLTGQTAKNMIKGSFLDAREVRSGVERPDVPASEPVRTLGVVGAGMMGAGIAYQAALVGIAVRLMDVDEASAQRGKDYARGLVDRQVKAGTRTQEAADALLGRITVVTEHAALAGVDAVVEAVFEDPGLKRKTFAELEPHVPGALLASNTSTLPISELASAVSDPDRFVGMHFFSPVDKMPLLELIVGRQTSPESLARAFDLAMALRKTPIVVNDKRGFFTSRVITKFTDEALAMVGEGLPAPSVEQAGLRAGYPAPPLQLSDELTLTLPHKVRLETKAAALDAGEEWVVHPGEPVMTRMVEEFDRKGRSTGGAFYEFVDGRRAGLWPGLREHFAKAGAEIPFADMVERMLFAESLEAVRCFEEGVLTSVAAANVGSLLGIGFPAWTGGVIQYIDGYPGGLPGFVRRAEELADRYGERLRPPRYLVEMSERSDRFAPS